MDEVTAQIEKWFAAYDLKPRPLPSIPEDPPPHEDAMIDLPLIVEPPDCVLIEVLEALPGRPISGERMVRPDGTMSLGFYGVIHVRGLTPAQIKIAIIKHLRRYLDDEILGLRQEPDAVDESPIEVVPPPAPGQNPFGGATPAVKNGEQARPRVPQPAGSRPRFISPEDFEQGLRRY